MSNCFSANDSEIICSSDYTLAKKRMNVYRTMQRSVLSKRPNARTAYLANNRNYRLKTPSQLARTNGNCLAQSHSYSDYLNMVRGKHYVSPKLTMPPGVGNWLPGLLQRMVTKPPLMQKTFASPEWKPPYLPNQLDVTMPPKKEGTTGWPATVTDPSYTMYRSPCNESVTSADISKLLTLYGVPWANAQSYLYYQYAMTQPSSGVMFPSKVSFDAINVGNNCCNDCGEGNGTWGAESVPRLAPLSPLPAPAYINRVDNKKQCLKTCSQ